MKNYSVAIFGSSLRNDFDEFSDKDLLIVAKDFKTLNHLKDIYSKEYWSMSFYTYSKLEFLAKNGSLFIKHLINEANIISDKQNLLENIFELYQAKKDYKNDIENSISYFKILQFIPDTIYGYAWFCDCFYVGLRNYLIFENAENNIYEFSFNNLIKLLKEQKYISNQDAKILLKLRIIKRKYRDNEIEKSLSYEYIRKIKSISKKLNLLNEFKLMNSFEYQKRIEKIIYTKTYIPYQKLRLLEGYYCSKELYIPEIIKVISNPQFYTMKLKSNCYIKNLISRINRKSTSSEHLVQLELKGGYHGN